MSAVSSGGPHISLRLSSSRPRCALTISITPNNNTISKSGSMLLTHATHDLQ
jgi:hypothetical protein